jgi:hypothetical protein
MYTDQKDKVFHAAGLAGLQLFVAVSLFPLLLRKENGWMGLIGEKQIDQYIHPFQRSQG